MSPRVLLVGSLAFTLAFNVAWAWGSGVLSVVAAAVCTLIVPAGLHLWPQVPAVTWLRRLLRAVVMSGICVAATVTSFSHSVTVLLASGWTPPTAWSVTGGAELLVALSTMAAMRTDTPTAAVADTPVRVADTPTGQVPTGQRTAPADVPDGAVVARPRKLSAVDPDRSARFRAWVDTLDGRPSNNAVRQRFGCRYDVARRLLEELDDADRVAV